MTEDARNTQHGGTKSNSFVKRATWLAGKDDKQKAWLITYLDGVRSVGGVRRSVLGYYWSQTPDIFYTVCVGF